MQRSSVETALRYGSLFSKQIHNFGPLVLRQSAIKGSCLCGTVRYEVDQLDMTIKHCRKAHAAAYASTAGVMREHFRWTAGKDRLSTFESLPGKLRRFCPLCGTHLVAERLTQPHVILRVATPDDDEDVPRYPE